MSRRGVDDEFFNEGNAEGNVIPERYSVVLSKREDHSGLTAVYDCPSTQCNQAFATAQARDLHYSVIHANQCSVCLASFPNARLRDMHFDEMHCELFQIQCEAQPMVSASARESFVSLR
jgi:hypothetical protein